MKNQYFGDVGDYGKYGLLRFIAKRGVTIAVNWYLTPYEAILLMTGIVNMIRNCLMYFGK